LKYRLSWRILEIVPAEIKLKKRELLIGISYQLLKFELRRDRPDQENFIQIFFLTVLAEKETYLDTLNIFSYPFCMEGVSISHAVWFPCRSKTVSFSFRSIYPMKHQTNRPAEMHGTTEREIDGYI
jgi:hypothetical protein